jgi:hypothetical protein
VSAAGTLNGEAIVVDQVDLLEEIAFVAAVAKAVVATEVILAAVEIAALILVAEMVVAEAILAGGGDAVEIAVVLVEVVAVEY